MGNRTEWIFVDEEEKVVPPEQATKCYENTYDDKGNLMQQKIFFTTRK